VFLDDDRPLGDGGRKLRGVGLGEVDQRGPNTVAEVIWWT
jgi:hypothetical protein